MINSRDILELHPTLQRGATELIRRARAIGLPVGISSTYRDAEYQDYLYEQGRSRPGTIVTNARAGESVHNYRLAFDIFKNIKGSEYNDLAFFEAVGKLWIDMGGSWGGSWSGFIDRPHFEFTNGITVHQMQSGSRMPANTLMKWEHMTQDQFNKHMTQYLNMRATLPASDNTEVKEALATLSPALTDGERLQAFATREEVIRILLRFIKLKGLEANEYRQ